MVSKTNKKQNIREKKGNIFRIIGWILILLGFIITIILSIIKADEIYSYIVLGIMIIGLILLFVNRYLDTKN